jgi:hypothetical protein
VGNEQHGIAEGGPGVGASFLTSANAASWRVLGLVGGAGVALGLLVGIPIGRATVNTAVSARPESPPKARTEEDTPPPPPAPARTYRASPGRHSPAGSVSRGFERGMTADKRRTAQIEGERASVRLALQPAAGESYALSAIARVDGAAGPTKLQTSWDGQALATWDLTNSWALYTSPVPAASLAAENHELVFAPTDLPADAVVWLDSIAVLPVGDELHFSMGAESAGHLVEGFSNPEKQFAWSIGQRSVIAAVLKPSPGAYQLNVRGSAYSHIAPISVRLRVNDKDVGSTIVTKETGNIAWQIPANVLRAGPNQLALEYSKTGQPSELTPGSKDRRVLAMRFYAVDLVPAERAINQ